MCIAEMCKAKVAKREVEKTNNNLGLINLEENNIATMGPVEIAIIILLVLGIMFLCRYVHRRCKKSGVRAVQEGMSRANQENMSRTGSTPTNTPMGIPMITFEQPGTRVVALQPTTATAPPAPIQVVQPPSNTGQASAGLWEQCR